MKRPLCFWALCYLLFHFLILSLHQTESRLLPFEEGEKLCFVGKVQQKSQTQNGVTLYLEEVLFQQDTGNPDFRMGEKQNKALKQKIGAICYMANQVSNPENQTLPELGCYVMVEGIYKPFSKATNQGQFDQKSYYETQNIHFSITKGRIMKKTASYHWLREQLWLVKQKWQRTYEKLCSEKEAGFLTSVVLGDKKSLDAEVKDLFSQNGIAHILAVSGVHLSILGMGLYKALKKVGVPEWMRVLGSLFLIFLYGVMIHAGVATLRAIMMLGINLCSKLLGRTYDMKVATAVAATLLIAGNPAYLTSAGFVLSFMAILALLLFYPFMQRNFGLSEQRCEKAWLRKLWDAFLVTFSITFFLLPVQTYYYYEIYPYSMFLNLIVLPLFTIVLYLGFAGGLVGMYFPLVGKFLLFPCKVIFVFYQWLCEATEVFAGNRVIIGKPSIVQVLIFYVFVMAVVYLGTVIGKKKKEKEKSFKSYRIFAIAVCFAACVVLCGRVRWNTQVVFLDVGQGDCCVIKEKGGMNLLIDGGSSDVSACGEYRLIPYLKSQGIEKIDYAFLSHLDVDHYSAILEAILSQKESGIEIQNLVLSAYGKSGEDYAGFVEQVESTGSQVLYIHPGDTLSAGDEEALYLQCLFPYGDEGFMDTNEQSMILYGQVGDFDMLFTGDIGTETEEVLLSRLENNSSANLIQNIDILKVAHHGSAGSTGEKFLQAVRPKVAIVSCGVNNQYGHPHKETLWRLEEVGSKILTTSECGAITIKIWRGKMSVECYLDRK